MAQANLNLFQCLKRLSLVPLLLCGLALGACAQLPLFESAEPDPAAAGEVADPQHDYARGKAALAAGRHGLAVLHFRAALRQEPRSVAALNGLGAAFDRLGRFDLSEQVYGQALAIDPRAATTLNNQGYSYYLQGRYDLAAAYLRDAAGRAGTDERILENRRLVEAAVARAGGPPSLAPKAAKPEPVAQSARRPRLVPAGKAQRHLITGPGQPAVDAPRVTADPGLLPGFLAAPMALDSSGAGRPALGARERPWP